MGKFILRRIILSIPVLFGILLVTFGLLRSIKGDPCTAMYGEKASPEVCDAFSKRYGLDRPIIDQLFIYMGNIAQGDFGDSFRHGRPVAELIVERLPTTVELALSALIFSIIVGIPMGIVSALRRNSWVDVGVMFGANIGVSMPVFWLGLMLSYVFGVILKDTIFALPPSGRLTPGFEVVPFYQVWGLVSDGQSASGLLEFISRLNLLNAILTLNFELFVDSLKHLILPAIAVGTIPLAIIARMTRSSLLEALGQDYVRTARAKGLRERVVVVGHALRNSMLPVVTVIGLNFGALIAGAVLTESVFGLSGVGRMVVDSITARDYAVVQGFTLFIAVSFVMINWAVDILYAFLDPRIRLQ